MHSHTYNQRQLKGKENDLVSLCFLLNWHFDTPFSHQNAFMSINRGVKNVSSGKALDATLMRSGLLKWTMPQTHEGIRYCT